MTIEETLKQMAGLQYPRQVDVVDRVMAEVSQHPYLQPVKRVVQWGRVSAIAAAAVVALLAVNVAVFQLRDYDEVGIGSAMLTLNDYTMWNTVEEAAVNPIEYLYEE